MKKTEEMDIIYPEKQEKIFMNKIQKDRGVSTIKNSISTAQDAMNLAERSVNIIKDVAAIFKESKSIESNIAKIEGATTIKLAQISVKFQKYQSVLEKVFGERAGGLNQYYRVLDKALESNDREMLILSLKGISDIVTTQPLAEIQSFLAEHNNNEIPDELDF